MSHFEQYYMRQAHGHGFGPSFSAASLQKGHGLGNILSSAFRTMVPVLKSAGKAVARQGLNTGLNILGDVLGGENIKHASKRRLNEGKDNLIKKAKTSLFSTLPPPPLQPKKSNKNKKRKNKNQSRHKPPNRKHKDIFG